MKRNYYELLQVTPAASDKVIRAAYHALCLENARNESRLKQFNEAKAVLLDSDQRSEYDAEMVGGKKPKMIGQYKVTGLISEAGGCAKTYKGEHVTLGTPVCIKHALKNSDFDQQLMEQEATAIWDLRHWGIPAIRDLHRLPDGSVAIIMSYVPGPTLEQVVEKYHKASEEFDPEHVAWITERILNILRYLHYNGVVHGDVKPQNIIIQPEHHTVVLVDYGLSLIRPKATDENKGFTPLFASPEQIDGKPLLPESDLYSLGKTMVYMLGGDLDNVRVPASTPQPLCDFMKRLIAFDVLSRPNWHKEDLIETFQKVRLKSFGRAVSSMKPLAF